MCCADAFFLVLRGLPGNCAISLSLSKVRNDRSKQKKRGYSGRTAFLHEKRAPGFKVASEWAGMYEEDHGNYAMVGRSMGGEREDGSKNWV